MVKMKRRCGLAAGAFAATAIILLGGCSASDGSGSESTNSNSADVNYHSAQGSPDSALQELLPADVAESGKLVIGTDATIGEPFASYSEDNVTVVGVAPDLAFAIGDLLGLDVELRHAVFANLIPGLKAKRYEFSVAPMLDTEERQKEVDFINYIRGGSAFVIAKDGGQPNDLTIDDVCGLRVGVAQGSVEEIRMTEQTEVCTAAGDPAIKILAYQTNTEGILALTSGRADVYATAAAQAGYIASTDTEKLAMSGEPLSSGLSAMAFPKESAMLPVVQKTLQKMMDSGAYTEIFASYGIDHLGLDKALVNSEEVE
jgi:polar amino acid transport system substrate-binding protein